MAELIRTEKELNVPIGSTIGREIRKLTQRVAFALRSTVSSITTYAPGHLIFDRDMIIHQHELIKWDKIYDRRRQQQIKDIIREIKGRNHEYRSKNQLLHYEFLYIICVIKSGPVSYPSCGLLQCLDFGGSIAWIWYFTIFPRYSVILVIFRIKEQFDCGLLFWRKF